MGKKTFLSARTKASTCSSHEKLLILDSPLSHSTASRTRSKLVDNYLLREINVNHPLDKVTVFNNFILTERWQLNL